MVEVLEYAIVVLVSSIIAGYSFGVYGGYAKALGGSTDQAAFDSVVALARAAIAHGSATASLAVDQARIGCESNSLQFTSPRFSQNLTLPVACSFPSQDLDGLKQLTFSYSADVLTLQVR